MKCTLLIDGNWLLMSRLFAYKDQFNVKNPESERDKATALLEDMMAKSINIVINRFKDIIDNVVIVQDGGSWRKTIEKPKGYEEVYKANRVKDVELDWTRIYRALDNIAEQAAANNITVSKAFGVEGDDWIWYWSRTLNEQHTNCIIWSIDADLKQLVQCHNGVFTAWYEHKPGLVLHKDFDDSTSSMIDIFMTPEIYNPTLDALRSQVDKVTYIDPQDIIESKVICGDAGDNIKPIIRMMKNNKQMKVSELIWQKTRNSLNINSLQDFFDKKTDITESILSNNKFKGCGISRSQLDDMFDYNIKLVWLNESVYPEDILDKMNESEYKTADMNYIRNNYRTLVKNKPVSDIESIFNECEIPF